MRGATRLSLGLVGALALLSALPASGSATMTIGSNLNRAPDLEVDCGASSCTLVQTGLAIGSSAPVGITSPVNGTITLWRLRAGLDRAETRLQVIRPLGGGLFTSGVTSSGQLPAANAISSFPASERIQIGDLIGLRSPGAPVDYFMANGGSTSRFQPILTDGSPGRAPDGSFAWEIALNVDIQPTNDFTVLRVRRNRKRGIAKLTVDVSNPGTLEVTGAGVRRAGAPASKPVSAPGQVTLVIGAAGRKRLELRRTGRVAVGPTITFTPLGGLESTRSVVVKLRKRR